MKENRIEKWLEADQTYSLRLAEISHFALEALQNGINERKRGKIESALKYYAIAMAFHKKQENSDGAIMCQRLIEYYINDEDELNQIYEYGSYSANKILHVIDSVNGFFGR